MRRNQSLNQIGMFRNVRNEIGQYRKWHDVLLVLCACIHIFILVYFVWFWLNWPTWFVCIVYYHLTSHRVDMLFFLLVDKDIHFGWHFYNAWINDDFFSLRFFFRMCVCNFHGRKKWECFLFFSSYFIPVATSFTFGRRSEKFNFDRLYEIPSIYYICERCSVFCVRNWHNILTKWNNNSTRFSIFLSVIHLCDIIHR